MASGSCCFLMSPMILSSILSTSFSTIESFSSKAAVTTARVYLGSIRGSICPPFLKIFTPTILYSGNSTSDCEVIGVVGSFFVCVLASTSDVIILVGGTFEELSTFKNDEMLKISIKPKITNSDFFMGGLLLDNNVSKIESNEETKNSLFKGIKTANRLAKNRAQKVRAIDSHTSSKVRLGELNRGKNRARRKKARCDRIFKVLRGSRSRPSRMYIYD